MKTWMCLLLLPFLLCACATTEILSSSPGAVIVKANPEWNSDEAQKLADKECAKQGKSARFNRFAPENARWGKLYYDCE